MSPFQSLSKYLLVVLKLSLQELLVGVPQSESRYPAKTIHSNLLLIHRKEVDRSNILKVKYFSHIFLNPWD